MKLSGILFVVIIVMGGIGYLYYKDTQSKMSILTANNAKLETAVALSEDAIASLQADYAAAQEETRRINTAYTEIRRQNNRLSEKLKDVDLSLLAAERPDSIERAINRGTANAGRCFEILSGAPLTETESNATSGEAFNRECPWLWTGPATSRMFGQQPAAN